MRHILKIILLSVAIASCVSEKASEPAIIANSEPGVIAIYRDGRGWGASYAKGKISINDGFFKYGDCGPFLEKPKISADVKIVGALKGGKACGKIMEAEKVIFSLIENQSEVEWTSINDLRLSLGGSSLLLKKLIKHNDP